MIISSNIREGKGYNVHPDGSVYEGWWQSDMPNGKGRFINSKDMTVYEGQWVDNEMHG